MTISLYHLRSIGQSDTSFRITKLDEDYSIEAAYVVSAAECSCPAGSRPSCRHRQMLPFFLAQGHIDNGWMLDWATRMWRKPLIEDGQGQPIGDDFPTAPPVDEMSEEELVQTFQEKVIDPILATSPPPYPALGEIKRGRRI